MPSHGLFTSSDLETIGRAGLLAENLAGDYFGMTASDWRECPYAVFTRTQVDTELHADHVFAQVFQYVPTRKRESKTDGRQIFGVALQDPIILNALLRTMGHDLWTLGLYIMTHEVIHVVRFCRDGVDFFADPELCRQEESLVHTISREILSGVANTDRLFQLYDMPVDHISAS